MRMYTLSLESAALGIPEQALSEGLGTHFIISCVIGSSDSAQL